MAKQKRALDRKLNRYIVILAVFIIGVALFLFLQQRQPNQAGNFHETTPAPSTIFPIQSQDSFTITLPKGWYERENTITKHSYKDSSFYSKKILYEDSERNYIEININPLGGDFLPDEVWEAEISKTDNALKITSKTPCSGIRCSSKDDELLIYVDVKGDKYKGHDYSIFVGNEHKLGSTNTEIFGPILKSIKFK